MLRLDPPNNAALLGDIANYEKTFGNTTHMKFRPKEPMKFGQYRPKESYPRKDDKPKDVVVMKEEKTGGNIPSKQTFQHYKDPRKCFNCGQVGHISIKCPVKKSNNTRESSNAGEVKPTVRIVREIQRSSKKMTNVLRGNTGENDVDLFLDWGADMSICQSSLVSPSQMLSGKAHLTGFGERVKGAWYPKAEVSVVVGDIGFTLVVAVVPDRLLRVGALIGADVDDNLFMELHKKARDMGRQSDCSAKVMLTRAQKEAEQKELEDDRKAAIEQGSKHKSVSEIDTDEVEDWLPYS